MGSATGELQTRLLHSCDRGPWGSLVWVSCNTPLLVVWPWASHLTSLSLSFLVLIISSSRDCQKDCLSFLVCHNKLPLLGRFKTTKIYSLTIPEARSPASRCWQGHTSSEILVLPSVRFSSFWRGPAALDIPWLAVASLQFLPPLPLSIHPNMALSLCLFFSSNKENQSLDLGPILTENYFILTWLYLQGLFLSKVTLIGIRG